MTWRRESGLGVADPDPDRLEAELVARVADDRVRARAVARVVDVAAVGDVGAVGQDRAWVGVLQPNLHRVDVLVGAEVPALAVGEALPVLVLDVAAVLDLHALRVVEEHGLERVERLRLAARAGVLAVAPPALVADAARV